MTVKTRRLRASGAALVAAVLMLAACNGAQPTAPGGEEPGEQDPGAEGAEGAEAAEVTGADISAWPLTGGVHEQLWTWSFDEWNEAHADQQVDYEFFANDIYKERIRTAIGAGTEPTLVFGWGGGTLAEYVANGNVVDITDGTQDLLDRVLPAVGDAGRIDGQVYAVPNSQSQPVVLYYNRELFDQVGLEVPTTWDEVMESVEVFNAEGIAPFSVAGQSRWPYLMWIQYLTDRIGGPEVFQAVLDNEPGAWDDPAIISALEHIQELVEADAFATGYGSVSADANADLALVHTGRAAMILQGSWVYSRFKEDAAEMVESGNLGVAPFPVVEGGAGDPGNIVGNTSNYWSVSANASPEQIETATTYLNEYVHNEDYVDFLIDGGGVPPIADIEDKLAEQDDSEFLVLAYELVRDAPHFQLSWDQALFPDPAQELLVNLDEIFLLQITPEEFVENMNATITQ